MKTLKTFFYSHLFFYRYIASFGSDILHTIFLIFWIGLIIKFRFSGQVTAKVGFILLIITVFFSFFSLDSVAGEIAQYVFILFVIAFIQEFGQYLKYGQKK